MKWSNLSKYRSELMGIAIIWVMLFHSSEIGITLFSGIPILETVGRIIKHGNMGVDVFLLLSGLGLYYSYSANQELERFYYKRFTKLLIPVGIIWFPYWIYLFFSGLLTGGELIRKLSIMYFWVDGARAIWYISLTIVLYLFFPLIYRFIYQREQGRLVRTVSLVSLVIIAILLIRHAFPEYYSLVEIALTRIPVFILGCFLGSLSKKEEGATYGWAFFLLAILMIAGFKLILDLKPADFNKRMLESFTAGVSTLVFSGLLELIHPYILKGLRWFGDMSLECYLIHLMLRDMYRKNLFFYGFEDGNIGRYLLLLVIAVALAWILHRIIDGVSDKLPKNKLYGNI